MIFVICGLRAQTGKFAVQTSAVSGRWSVVEVGTLVSGEGAQTGKFAVHTSAVRSRVELAPTEEVDGERAGGAYYFVSIFEILR